MERVNSYLSVFEPLPRVLPHTIRGIRNASALFAERPAVDLPLLLTKVTYLVLRAPTVAASIIGATWEYCTVHLEDNPELSAEKMPRLLGPDMTCAVLALSYVARKLASRCPSDQWESLYLPMRIHVSLGRIAGIILPEVGPGLAMLSAGLRYAAVGAFLAADPLRFEKYPIATRQRDELFRLSTEKELFGVTHLQVAAGLTRLLGFGLDAVQSFFPREEESEGFARSMVQARRLTEVFQLYGNASHEEISKIGVSIPSNDVAKIQRELEMVLSNPDTARWLTANPAEETRDNANEKVPDANTCGGR